LEKFMKQDGPKNTAQAKAMAKAYTDYAKRWPKDMAELLAKRDAGLVKIELDVEGMEKAHNDYAAKHFPVIYAARKAAEEKAAAEKAAKEQAAKPQLDIKLDTPELRAKRDAAFDFMEKHYAKEGEKAAAEQAKAAAQALPIQPFCILLDVEGMERAHDDYAAKHLPVIYAARKAAEAKAAAEKAAKEQARPEEIEDFRNILVTAQAELAVRIFDELAKRYEKQLIAKIDEIDVAQFIADHPRNSAKAEAIYKWKAEFKQAKRPAL
jgi:hypothetical protein